MKFNIDFVVACSLASLLAASVSVPAYAANSAAMMMSAEAAADGADDHAGTAAAIANGTTQSPSSAGAISRASLFDSPTTRRLPFTLSAFSMFSGPSVGSFSTATPTTQNPNTGVSARHEVKLDYQASRRVTISPVMDVSELFYNQPGQGALVLNDPSVRVAVADVNYARWGKTTFDASIWASTYAPVSTQSQQMHEYPGFSLAYLPKLHFRGSRFFLSGVTEAKVTPMENQAQTGLIAPVSLIGGLQGNYRISSRVTAFIMNHVSDNVGPNVGQIMSSTALGQQNVRQKAKQQAQGSNPVTDGFMIGSMFQVIQGIALSPRLDWSVNQPIGTTTVGVNASFSII